MRAQRLQERLRSNGRDHAVEIRDSGAQGDQREHVRAAVDERGPEALEERPAAPEHDRRGERELNPGSQTAATRCTRACQARSCCPWRSRAAEQSRTRLIQKRRVMSRSSGFSSARSHGARLKGHAADGARSGPGAHDLGMHGAGVLSARGRDGNVRLQRHAARGTRTRLRS